MYELKIGNNWYRRDEGVGFLDVFQDLRQLPMPSGLILEFLGPPDHEYDSEETLKLVEDIVENFRALKTIYFVGYAGDFKVGISAKVLRAIFESKTIEVCFIQQCEYSGGNDEAEHQHLATAAKKNTSLRRVAVDNVSSNSGGLLEAISQLSGILYITMLGGSDENVDDAMYTSSSLQSISHCKTLKELISFGCLNEKHGDSIAKIIRSNQNSLEKLFLINFALSDKSLAPIAEAMKDAKTIKRLAISRGNLSGTIIPDDLKLLMVKMLAGMTKANRSLERASFFCSEAWKSKGPFPAYFEAIDFNVRQNQFFGNKQVAALLDMNNASSSQKDGWIRALTKRFREIAESPENYERYRVSLNYELISENPGALCKIVLQPRRRRKTRPRPNGVVANRPRRKRAKYE